MDAVKKLSDLIPFFEPYPIWVKWLAGTWTILTAVFLLALVFGRSPSAVKGRVLHGQVRDTTHAPVSAATIEVITSTGRTDTTSDSDGRFHVDTRRIARDDIIRVRVAAAGHRPYEREIQVNDNVTDLGEFSLQRDGDNTAIATKDVNDFVSSLQNANLAGLPGHPTRDDVYQYLDSVAADADSLAAAWVEILRDLDSRKSLDAVRLQDLQSKYHSVKMPNAPYFARLTSFLWYLQKDSKLQVTPAWAAEVSSLLGELLYERQVSSEALDKYLSSIGAAISSGQSPAADPEAVNKSVEKLQMVAARLHALAKTARVNQRVPNETSPHKSGGPTSR